MTISEIRNHYPQYNHLSDEALTQALYGKFYAGKMDYPTFLARLNARPPAAEQSLQETEKKRTGRGLAQNALEGLAFGAGDVVAGITNKQMSDLARVTHGQTLTDKTKGAADLLLGATPAGLIKSFASPEFKTGRREFVEEKDAFNRENPQAALAAELAGGLMTGGAGAGRLAGAKGLAKLGKVGYAAVTGAAGAAAYGAGAGLTKNPEELSVTEAAKDALSGAVLGGVLGAAVPAAVRAGRSFKGENALEQLVKAAGEETVEKAARERVPLLNIANRKTAKLGKIAKRADEEAADTLDTFIDERFLNQGNELENLIVQKVSPAKKLETAQTLLENKQALSRAAYEPMEALGDLSAINPALKETLKNPMVQNALQSVRRNVPEYARLPDTDFRVLNEAKKILDDWSVITAATPNFAKTPARFAGKAKEALKTEIDKATGGAYKKALADYGDLLAAEKALESGRKLLNASAQEAARLVKQAGAFELEAMKTGLAEELTRRIRNADMTGSTRDIASAVGASRQKQDVLKEVLGDKAQEIIGQLEARIKANKNYNLVARGFDTVENRTGVEQTKNILQRAGSLIGLAGEAGQVLKGKLSKSRQRELAELLVNPDKLRAAWEGRPVELSGNRFSNITGPLTTGEKDALRKDMLAYLHQNVQGTGVGHPSLRQVDFPARGINKTIHTSASKDKLEMLKDIPEIVKKGVVKKETPHATGTYYWLETPVRKDGKNLVAGTTVRGTALGNKFYNVNPIQRREVPGVHRADGSYKKNSSSASNTSEATGVSNGSEPMINRGAGTKRSTGTREATNSIAKKAQKIKRSLYDLLILGGRPFALGAVLGGQISKAK